MPGIVIEYDLAGDEEAWRKAVDAFIEALKQDWAVNFDFGYMVTRVGDTPTRIHVGRWGKEETLKLLQSRDYFKTFSQAIQEFAGGAPNARRVEVVNVTP